MEFRPASIAGCVEAIPLIQTDLRGRFIKTYHEDIFHEQGINTSWREEYFTYSRKGVLRGMHFQLPPHDHHKLVYCVKGTVLDAVVDLRKGSPTFQTFQTFTLDSGKGTMLVIPPGLAHGFYCLSDEVVLFYKVSSVYAADQDTGIHWDSVGIPWPNTSPILSERDRSLPPLQEFHSPFTFDSP